MVLKKNKVKLVKEDTTTRRKPVSNLVIYLTAVKAAQFIQVADNRIERKEAKKETARNAATIKVHIQIKISEAFDGCINSINIMSPYNTNKEIFIQIIQQSSNNIKDSSVQIGGKLAELPNQRRDTVSRYMIRILN